MIFSGIVVPISTIDWYGRSVSVIFFNGCSFRCPYCGNNEFIEVTNNIEPVFKKGHVIDIKKIEKQILEYKFLISGVVFSGGEPTEHFEELKYLAKSMKNEGLLVGVETNGYYPKRIMELIEKKLVDKIFLDIKASPKNKTKYSLITGISDASERVMGSLFLKGVSIEVRTTVFRSICDVLDIADALKGIECTYVIQQGIPEYAPNENIKKEKPFTRDELFEIANKVSFLGDVRIRTKEKGEEKIF